MSSDATRGTPTFLFTDIEGSTRMLQELGDLYAEVLDQHRALIGSAVESAGGRVFGTEGDALFCAFETAAGAIQAAVQAQRSLAGHAWPAEAELRVRMGIHSGEALLIGGDYVGLAVHQVARIMSAGHGGQVLVSEATRRLLPSLPAGIELRDLGERRLKDLAAPERIYQVVAEGLAEQFPPLRTLDTRANNLPVQVTSFVGRAELAAAREELTETRLLTLTGPGGTGKTRLGLQLAGDVSDEFDGGVFFVALDSVTDPDLLPSVIASTLGLAVGGSVLPLDAAIEYLRDRRALLLLDNFEQIVDAAPVVARLLQEAPRIKIIVTTRIVLRVYGERELPVPPLGLPPADLQPVDAESAGRYEAVELFFDRGRAVQPQLELTDENAPLVVDIVRRLDGLPLAIELAAARARALPLAAIHARLDHHLSLLTGGSRDLPGRQQTLRGAIDWSYDLLEPADRRLFERFSIHAGGAFLTEADEVCGPAAELGEDVLDGLSSLADKSLVRSDPTAGTDPRFAMLATIRDYAYEHLATGADFEDLARRHAAIYLALAEALAPELTGRQGRQRADRLEQDHDNLRAALDWAVAHGEVAYALRFIAAVWRFWQIRGHLDEARRRVDLVMAMPGVGEQPDELLVAAAGAAGSVAYWQADTRAAHRYYGRALEAARRTGDDRLIAEALYNMGFASLDVDSPTSEVYAAGRPFWEESLAMYRKLGDSRGVADASWGLASALAGAGDLEAALQFSEEAVTAFRGLDDPFRLGWGLYLQGGMLALLGNWDAIEPLIRESLRIFLTAQDRAGIQFNLLGFALIAAERGQRERANRIGGAAESLRQATGAGLLDSPIDFVAFKVPTRPAADDAEALEWWEEGARMSAEEAATYALGERDTQVSAG